MENRSGVVDRTRPLHTRIMLPSTLCSEGPASPRSRSPTRLTLWGEIRSWLHSQ